VQVVHNPVPETYFENSVSNYASSNRRYIGFAAANLNNPYKDLQVFVKAVNKLNEISSERVSVLLIGEGPAPDFSPDIEVSQSNPKSDSGMIEEFKKIRTLVVPSNQDNSPSVVSEALAMGIPVIGSNVGGIPEILKDFRLPIFEPGDYLQLALLLNESISASITSDITSLASRKFSEKIIAQQLFKIYSGKS
jgi:glycosyltransferase involved in cell wall biosynthesis